MKIGYFLSIALLLLYNSEVIHAECGGNSFACAPLASDGFLYTDPYKSCYEDGDKIEYFCTGHFHGPPENICSNGKWRLPTPTCEGFTCDKPKVDKSVRLIPDKPIFDTREEVQFACNEENSILEGLSFANCEKEGWYPNTYTKIFCSVKCDIPTIEYGTVHMRAPTKKGDTVKITCDNGYEISVGDSQRITCGDDGKWEHLPRCMKL